MDLSAECFSDLAASVRTDAERVHTSNHSAVKNVCYSLKIIVCKFYAFISLTSLNMRNVWF